MMSKVQLKKLEDKIDKLLKKNRELKKTIYEKDNECFVWYSQLRKAEYTSRLWEHRFKMRCKGLTTPFSDVLPKNYFELEEGWNDVKPAKYSRKKN